MDVDKHEGLSDGMLEKEVEAVLGVDPSPEFLPQVRARIATERAHDQWLPSWQWTAVGVAVAAVTILALWVARDPGATQREDQLVSAPHASRVENRAANRESRVPGPVAVPSVRKVRAPRPPAVTAPEVLISQDEAAALRQLFAAINDRRFETSVLPELASSLKPPDPIADIVLEPITISPLASLESE
jgi:hypothetical protein